MLLASACTKIIRVFWKLFLKISEKILYVSTINIFRITNEVMRFPKAHCATCFDVISVTPLNFPIPNPIIHSKHVRILCEPSWYGILYGSQNSNNTILYRLLYSVMWSMCCTSLEHYLSNHQFPQALMNWYPSILPICNKNGVVVVLTNMF